jgi:hypothetical protein
VQLAVLGQPLDGRDLEVFGAVGGDETAMDRYTIEPDGAGAAVARVASLFDAEPSQLTQKGAQALTGGRFLGERLAVDVIGHDSLRSW